MRFAFLLCVLLACAGACSGKQSQGPGPQSNAASSGVLQDTPDLPQPPANEPRDAADADAAEPTKTQPETGGFSVNSSGMSITGQYARELRLLYIEQGPRWQ